jgi:hypothetical protein
VQFDYGLTDGGRGTPLLKLHGSLNWGRKRGAERGIVPYDVYHYVNNYRLQNYFARDDDAAPLTTTDISIHMAHELRKHQDVEDEPVLVPPTWSKGEYHREISNVWARAARELGSAKYIFVLGYSLPETDQFFRLLFALGTEGRTIINKIAVFDPTPKYVEQRFRAMLGNAALDRFEVHPCDFGAGLRHIETVLFTTGKRRPR